MCWRGEGERRDGRPEGFGSNDVSVGASQLGVIVP